MKNISPIEHILFSKRLDFQASLKVRLLRTFDKSEANIKSKANSQKNCLNFESYNKLSKVVKDLGNPIDFYRKLSGRFNYYCCKALRRFSNTFGLLQFSLETEELHCNTYKNGSYNFTFAR